jgi:hypothetical protein
MTKKKITKGKSQGSSNKRLEGALESKVYEDSITSDSQGIKQFVADHLPRLKKFLKLKRFQKSKYEMVLESFVINLLQCRKDGWLRTPRNSSFFASYQHVTAGTIKNVSLYFKKLGYIKILNGYFDRTGDHTSYVTKVNAKSEFFRELEDYGVPSSTRELNRLLMFKATPERIILKDENKEELALDHTRAVAQRANLRRYNELLAQSEVELNGDVLLLPSLHRVYNNGRFSHGGRYYGGAWESVNAENRKTILIDGQSVTECDYSALHYHMLYSKKGLKCSGDPYDLSVIANGYGVQEVPRKAIKSLALLMINCASPRGAKAEHTKEINKRKRKGELVYEMEPAVRDKVMEAIVERHSEIVDSFYRKNSFKLQNSDSKITEMVLKHFTGKGVLVLPVHDGYVVQRAYQDELRDVMGDAYKSILKHDLEIPITIEY